MADPVRYSFPAPNSYPNWLRLALSLVLLFSLWLWPEGRLPLQALWQLMLAPLALLPWLVRAPETLPFLLADNGEGVELGSGEPFRLDRRSWVLGSVALLWVQPGGRRWWLSRGQMDRAGWHRLCRILVRLGSTESEP
ncbi:hypothetical protein [Ferrimonas futtsuensis]|uniref:hypothetical protein n=1 Tax=Ferrimonas futtsuensis TaxID=364764 RepID=UPI00054CE2F7|nr:hypothetical protein [Ferrimonas futtsuensis]